MSVTEISNDKDDTGGVDETDPNNAAGELHQAIWSVISFRKREAEGATYFEALRIASELENKGIAGLCVVTDDAAQRVASSSGQ